MVITITHRDIWEEFVYYRKIGHHRIAFDHLRRYGSLNEWECIIAALSYRKHDLKIGDIITMPSVNMTFIWDELFHEIFTRLSPREE